KAAQGNQRMMDAAPAAANLPAPERDRRPCRQNSAEHAGPGEGIERDQVWIERVAEDGIVGGSQRKDQDGREDHGSVDQQHQSYPQMPSPIGGSLAPWLLAPEAP